MQIASGPPSEAMPWKSLAIILEPLAIILEPLAGPRGLKAEFLEASWHRLPGNEPLA